MDFYTIQSVRRYQVRNIIPLCSMFKDQVHAQHCSLTKTSVPTYKTAEYQNSECHSHKPAVSQLVLKQHCLKIKNILFAKS
jgi:hypothetical protein